MRALQPQPPPHLTQLHCNEMEGICWALLGTLADMNNCGSRLGVWAVGIAAASRFVEVSFLSGDE